MTHLVAVDNKNHLNTKIDLSKIEQHGADLHLVPVVLSEFIHLAVQYPIVLTKHGETGQFVFSAMLGFEKNENLFWQEEQWQGLYVPLQVRRQPFFIEAIEHQNNSEHDNNELVVCVNMESPALSNNTGEALFDINGQESTFFQEAKDLLAQLLTGEKENNLLLESLTLMGLIQPMSLDITFVDQSSTKLLGLYTIDQEKLTSLSKEQVLTLYQAGLLPSIYTMITSLGQVHALIDLKNKRLNYY
ncbi:MAG: SapC family protein [Alteromonadaceae bacterium]|jgi:hypothetical protein